MSFKYLSHKCFLDIEKGSYANDQISFVGTYSDLLFLGDGRKGKITKDDYMKLKTIFDRGNVFLVELDEVWFQENAFDIDEDGNPFLDKNVHCADKTPLFTCNYVSLKPNCDSAYWDNELFEEFMNE